MKKIIGIIPSTLGFDTDNPFDDKYYVQNSYIEKIDELGGIPIIIPPINLNARYNSLDLCDSLLIIGGRDAHKYHFEVIEYAIKTNKKLLGICLGMQAIAMYSNNDFKEESLYKINNHYYDKITHKNKELLKHNITINKDSKLASIIGTNISVNSIHKYAVKYVTAPFKIVGTNKNIIEAIEYKNIIGVQFHPELMKKGDKLFKWLIT